MEREVLISSPWDPVPGRVGMAQSCIPQGRLGLDMRKSLFTKRVLNPWNRLPMPRGQPVLKRHLDNTRINILLRLVRLAVVRQLDSILVVGPLQLNSSILFDSR